ncbi:PD-(D/E)XK motif protein [Maricaulis sp.]|uniref:PD-(D/E)XK motif protein n=1 Tax=Maricaulis sp. TaxID=1486257 RepID=UPI002B26B9B4|nr:PD-(D/E)XK motif protein [Maricaulis sp.]
MIEIWAEITKPKGNDLNFKRCDPDHPLDLFLGREADGKYILFLEGLKESLEGLPSLAGVEMLCRADRHGTSALVLRLVDVEQETLFKSLCEDLLQGTRKLDFRANSTGAFLIVKRMRRWQELFQRRKTKLLSRQQIIGLVGELVFLREVLNQFDDADAALRSWRGPYGDEQDFAIGDTIVETKTQLSTADQALKISSEAQLDTTSGPIIVVHQTIASTERASPNSLTLNEHVADIRSTLETASPVAIDFLEAGLLAAGYQERSEYDEEAWEPVTRTIFEIENDFPRLVPGNMQTGIERVRYQIMLDFCREFQRSDEWLDERVFSA